MQKLLLCIYTLILFILFVVSSHATPIVVSGVQEYANSYGCAPTAAASLLNFYGLPVDTGLLAQAMGTTGAGATNVMDVAPGIESYTRGNLTAVTYDYREFSYSGNSAWLNYKNEIDAGRPVLTSQDSNGCWSVEHMSLAIGYEDRGVDGLYYGFYTGWEDTERIQWEKFGWSVFSTASWGIGFFTTVTPGLLAVQSVPEPTTTIMIGIGLIFITTITQLKSRKRREVT